MVHKKYLLHKNSPENVVYINVVTKHNTFGSEHWKPEPIYKENIFVKKRLLDIGIMHGFLVTTWNGHHQDVITKGADQQQFQGTSEYPAAHTVGVGLSDIIQLSSKDHIKFLKSLIGRVVISEGGKGKNQGIHKFVDNWVEIILRSNSVLTEKAFQKFVKYLFDDIEENTRYSKEGQTSEGTETAEIYKKELGSPKAYAMYKNGFEEGKTFSKNLSNRNNQAGPVVSQSTESPDSVMMHSGIKANALMTSDYFLILENIQKQVKLNLPPGYDTYTIKDTKQLSNGKLAVNVEAEDISHDKLKIKELQIEINLDDIGLNTKNMVEDALSQNAGEETGIRASKLLPMADGVEMGKHNLGEESKSNQTLWENIKEGVEISKKVFKLSKFLCRYGIMAGLKVAQQLLQRGNIVKSFQSFEQKSHSITSTRSGTALTKKTFLKVDAQIISALEKRVTDIAAPLKKSLATDVVPAVKKLGSKLVRLVQRSIPIVGMRYGIKSVYEDIIMLTEANTTEDKVHFGINLALDIVDLFLDNLPMKIPHLVAIQWAIKGVSLVIDDIWEGISSEIRKVDCGESNVGRCAYQYIEAVIIGTKKGIVKFAQDVASFFNDPFGQFDAIKNKILEDVASIFTNYPFDAIRETKQFEMSFHNVNNYFSVTQIQESNSSFGIINFSDGILAAFGGEIFFRLYNAQFVNVCIKINTLNRCITEQLTDGDNNIVMGIGLSHNIKYRLEIVKALGFIYIDTKQVVDGLEKDHSNLVGEYHGNDKGNQFLSIRTLLNETIEKLGYSLSDYSYKLFGHGGDDTFHIGPQKFYIEGGNGRDKIIIPVDGGDVTINFASEDEIADICIFSSNFDDIQVSLNGSDLYLHYSNKSSVIVMNWKNKTKFENIDFYSEPGIIFIVNNTHEAKKEAKLATFDLKTVGVEFNADIPDYLTIEDIHGSPGNDKLTGNNYTNRINGFKGNDYLEGKGGQDQYVIGNGNDIINNFAEDTAMDLLVLEASATEVGIIYGRSMGDDLQLVTTYFSVTLKNWFKGERYQHLLIATADFYTMKISTTKTCIQDNSCLTATGVDGSLSENGINVNLCKFVLTLKTAANNLTQHINSQLNASKVYLPTKQQPLPLTIFKDVHGMLGSKKNDILIGNEESNQITGGKGDDFLKGSCGSDIYLIRPGDGSDTIDNFAEDLEVDFILLDAKFDDFTAVPIANDLKIESRFFDLNITNWFLGVNYQHLQIISSDFFIFELNISKFCVKNNACVMATRFDARNSDHSVQINLAEEHKLSKVVSIIGSEKDDELICNNESNVISGGKGNDYLKGGEGSDHYFISQTTTSEVKTINNKAMDGALDHVLLKDIQFKEISLNKNNFDLILKCKKVTVKVLNWFLNEKYQHIEFRTSDGFTFTPDLDSFILEPETVAASEHVSSLLLFNTVPDNCLESNCSYVSAMGCTEQEQSCPAINNERFCKTENMFSTQKLRVIKGSTKCSIIEGNNLDNLIYFEGSSGHLKGNNGSDKYFVKNSDQDQEIIIDNAAQDNQMDILNLEIDFSTIKIERKGLDLTLNGSFQNRTTKVVLSNYFNASENQHLMIKMLRGETFTVTESSKGLHIVHLAIDRSAESTEQKIDVNQNNNYSKFNQIVGARSAPNHIIGGYLPLVMEGGDFNDILEGSLDEDTIKGGGMFL